jgi:hypothetical protein
MPPDLLRQSIYSRLAGYEDLNDAERLLQDPTFQLIGSERIWNRGAARLHWIETEVLTQAVNTETPSPKPTEPPQANSYPVCTNLIKLIEHLFRHGWRLFWLQFTRGGDLNWMTVHLVEL